MPSYLDSEERVGGTHRSDLDITAKYPYLQFADPIPQVPEPHFWHYGGWFLKDDQVPAGIAIPDEFWLEKRISTGASDTGLGFRTFLAAVLAVRYKKDFCVKHQDGKRSWYESYDEAARHAVAVGDQAQSRTRLLCLSPSLARLLVEPPKEGEAWDYTGLPDEVFGPFILTAYTKRGQRLAEAFQAFRAKFVEPLGRKMNRQFDDYWFAMPVRASSDPERASNRPDISTQIYVPKLALPDDVGNRLDEYRNRLYVGDRLVDLGDRWWNEAQAWATAPLAGRFGEPVTENEAPEAPGAPGAAPAAPFRGGTRSTPRPARYSGDDDY